jgi:hypothetical protein
VPVRAYVPLGDRDATYGIGEAARNAATVAWLFQDLLLGKGRKRGAG